MDFFSRLKKGLSQTRKQISSIMSGGVFLDDVFYGALEEALVTADVGYDLTLELIDHFKEIVKNNRPQTIQEAYAVFKNMLVQELNQTQRSAPALGCKPWVILMVGVNGVGKTTTIGKLSHEYREQGKRVLIGAVDTFRAGAIEQLGIWASRTKAEFISQHEGADPASVAFDALEAAKARSADVVLLDTAGRLHNKVNLMSELEKIVRVLKRNTPDTPNEVLLVVDATTGQNALKQTEVFHGCLGITGFVITKLDGTAKGGIALALTRKFGIPIRKIGVGEALEDLQDFNPQTYIEAMFGAIDEAKS